MMKDRAASNESPATVGALLRYLAPGLAGCDQAPRWPPDAFALAATVLHRSGGYRVVVGDWPPPPESASPWDDVSEANPDGRWEDWITSIGEAWRQGWEFEQVSESIDRWWGVIRDAGTTSIALVASDAGLCTALVQLMAAADGASSDIGVAGLDQEDLGHPIVSRGNELLARAAGTTLCSEEIAPWAVRVLPKMHTPQKGITIRSLSHHLALCPAEEVVPWWLLMPRRARRTGSLVASAAQPDDQRMLNLLVIPWPETIGRHQFEAVGPRQGLPRNMASNYGFFRFRNEPRPDFETALKKIYQKALKQAKVIDAIVLPELALTDHEYKLLEDWAVDRNVLLIAGVAHQSPGGGSEQNVVALGMPWLGRMQSMLQPKHHRWQLDRSQIETYGLGGHLRPDHRWWELSRVDERSLYFVSLLPWLTLCVLVCEDLAQQEPVARMVRAVGPNLVIAVLMDGPQLATRWPARYATVLADDPGSSVLTVTSIGMCERSVPAGKQPSRVVAMWKDNSPRSRGPREIVLDEGKSGLVLNLLLELDEEHTADGRSDGRQAGRPVLVGAYSV